MVVGKATGTTRGKEGKGSTKAMKAAAKTLQWVSQERDCLGHFDLAPIFAQVTTPHDTHKLVYLCSDLAHPLFDHLPYLLPQDTYFR